MKLILQILFFFLTWFTNLVNATPVFTKVVLPNYDFAFSKTENVKNEIAVKIDVHNFARSGLEVNLFSQKGISKVSYALVVASRAGVRVVVNGAGSLFSKLDNLGLTALKNELNLLDNATKAKFLDEFAEASDDVLKTLNKETDLVNLWKTYSNQFKNARYITETGAFKSCQSVAEAHPSGYLGNLAKKVMDAPKPSSSQVVIVGVTHPNFNGKVFLRSNFTSSEASQMAKFLQEDCHPILRNRAKYMNFIRNSVTDANGVVTNPSLANKLLDIDNLNKLTTAGRAGYHGEIRALSDALYELEKTQSVTANTLSEFDMFIRNSSNKVMQRCPCCFHISNGTKILEGK